MEKKTKNSPFLRQCLVISAVYFDGIGKGAMVGFPSILIPGLRESSIDMTQSRESWIASVVAFTQIPGIFIMMATVDTLGRRTSYIISLFTLLAAWCLLILGNEYTSIIVARLLHGLGQGLSGTTGSVIIAEMSEPKLRGPLLVGSSIFITVGILFVHSLGQVLSWRYTALACSFMTAISIIIVNYSPESPSWLVSKGRLEECREVFRWLRGTGTQQEIELEKLITGQLINKKSRESTTVNQDAPLTRTTRIKRFFSYLNATYKKPEFYKPMMIVLHLHMLLQFSGTNILNSYLRDIIVQLIGSDINVELLIILLNVERLVATILSLFVVKYFKRRTILYITGPICVILYLVKGAYITTKQNNFLPYDSQWIPIFLLFSFMFTVACGFKSTPRIVSGEIFPLEYRGWAGGLSRIFGSLFFFTSVKWFPVLTTSMGLGATYCFYAGIITYSLLVLWYLLPETKDKTLQDIEDNFRGKIVIEDKEMLPFKSDNRQII